MPHARVAHADEIYRWVDPDGRVHFGTQPPSDATDVRKQGAPATETVNVVPPPESSASTDPWDWTDPPAADRLAPRETDAARRLRMLQESEQRPIGGRSEAAWRREAEQHERSIESLEKRLAKAEDDLSSSYSLGSNAHYQRRVDSLKAQLEAARESQESFEDRARELGVPPGWLR